MPLTRITDTSWLDLTQVVHAEYVPGDAFRRAVLAITLSSGQAVRLTDPAQIADVAKSLAIALPTPGLIAP
jgi:voltage-gated potassium channel Kch